MTIRLSIDDFLYVLNNQRILFKVAGATFDRFRGTDLSLLLQRVSD